ncbi:hypothetical protein EPUS_01096 [Endocarpon pusillum Z07020]|uniref:Uncharacterized protein n=1 Tax=Endocarpon pusillum (strain Z07020 / HMAS-L-300199) TaxID=1263415 RepID=U1HGA8_ENDPU|nr:uncharacterized protein EPUS_01096 [Endocarpon pusillum Z07020]ERF69140.1 hypothetical protein EPUS_01096 [Endocarpon pusillum Z07020]
MNDVSEYEVIKAPLTSLSRRRYARIPNTSEFWHDLFLAKSASRSSSIEVRAACLYATKWRAQDDTGRPRTIWDDILVEVKWLREDYKCDIERKKDFMREVANPCAEEALQRLQRICSRREEEDSGQNLRNESTIPEWAKEEYSAQRVLANEHRPEPLSEEGVSEHDIASQSPNQLPAGGKRKAATLRGGRKSKRLCYLADAGSR